MMRTEKHIPIGVGRFIFMGDEVSVIELGLENDKEYSAEMFETRGLIHKKIILCLRIAGRKLPVLLKYSSIDSFEKNWDQVSMNLSKK